MRRPNKRQLVSAPWLWRAAALGAIVLVPCAPSPAQTPNATAPDPDSLRPPAPTGSPADIAIETYLQRLGLKELLADHLSDRVRQAPIDERKSIGERLARIYVDMLAQATTPESRKTWEDRGRELLQIVPEADSYELRISLAKASYIHAEDILERHRLRLTKPDETAEAERLLRAVKPDFADIAAKVNARVDHLERLEQTGRDTDAIAPVLAEARRLRSLAFYYAGWTDYYLAYLSGNERLALDASRAFGWLLNARGGNPASLERISPGLLKYEHIARAAIGCALAASIRGNDTEALRWLNAVAEAPGVPEVITSQLLPRRISILAAARRWSDLDVEVRRARKADRSGGGPNVEPLPVLPARLLAVVALEADKGIAADIAERLARIALADLIAGGEVGQVLDIVQRYGTAPIGDTGFIVNYVRGVQAFEQAREAHRQSGADAEEPAAADALINQYRKAASLLDAAMREDDAASFGAERAKAAMIVGQAFYFAGDLIDAAERFLESAKAAPSKAAGEDAMWFAVAALDRAVKKGLTSATKRRDEVATLFLQTYGESPRAAQLLVSVGSTNLVDDNTAVRVLLGVPRDSPSYEGARRQAARLLYNLYRTAPEADRDFAAVRFVSVAEEILAMERRAALEGQGAAAREAADRAIVRVRQILDAILSTPTVDTARAESAIQTLEQIANHTGIDLAPYAPELLYRRIQIHLGRGQTTEAAALAETLAQQASAAKGSAAAEAARFAESADRLLYRAALLKWQRAATPAPESAAARDAVIRLGTRIIDRLGSTPQALVDPAVLSLHATVADAAAQAWEQSRDEKLRDLSIRLDRAVLSAQPRSEATLRRLARTAESAGDAATALECWRSLLAGVETGSPKWFEARYEAIRLLAALDPARARAELQQHKLLYPAFGPEPWGAKIKSIDDSLAPAPPPGGAP